MSTPSKNKNAPKKKLPPLTSREMMAVFASLTTRPQYTQITNVTESGNDILTSTEFTVVPKAPRLAETDPARLDLAKSVMFAVLALYEHERELTDNTRHRGPILPGPMGIAN